jgi:hypothetical protein
MRFTQITGLTTMAVALILGSGTFSQAQTAVDPERLAGLREKLAQVEAVLDALPDSSKKRLSSGAQNLLKLAQGWQDVEGTLAQLPGNVENEKNALRSDLRASAASDTPDDPAASFPISRASADFVFSIMAGFTQSETSTAWCGNNVVTGFNDSGSIFESLLFGPGGVSGSGASISSNKGSTFQDVGYINPGTDFNNFLAGDPVVTCALLPQAVNPTFFYTQLFELGPSSAPLTAIAFSKSTDGGGSWSSPLAAVQKDARTHFLDKDWSAVDPTNPSRIFVSYTDFDRSGTSGAPACGFVGGNPVLRLAIELVRSSDGGATWSDPLVIVQGCVLAPNFPQVQGSQIVVDSAGSVYVAWESFQGGAGIARSLLISKSTNNGSTFGAPVIISNVIETGDGDGLQGGFRNNEFPMVAVDRSSGALWVAWNDGRNFAIRDFEAPDGMYHFADILVSRSITGGATWSAPVVVSPPQAPHFVGLNLLGTDHYQPGIAVDRMGAIAACWYDRRGDPANFRFGRACSISTNSGVTWTQNFFINGNWSPVHATDVFINPAYFGDYDTVASDFLLINEGFLGAFGFVSPGGLVPNQDVAIFSVP